LSEKICIILGAYVRITRYVDFHRYQQHHHHASHIAAMGTNKMTSIARGHVLSLLLPSLSVKLRYVLIYRIYPA